MTIPILRWASADAATRERLMMRSGADISDRAARVAEIIARVRAEGDSALIALARELDGADLAGVGLRVSDEEFAAAARALDPAVREAIDYAVENVRRFHAAAREEAPPPVEVRPGVVARDRIVPIDRVGLYVPHGRGSFPSMTYMLAVPAVIAGVPELVIATPPERDGSVDAGVLYAAAASGVRRVVRMGGAQAIAAFAFGTASVPAVHKVVGPGSAWVAAAKRALADRLDVGLPAGPSESLIIADAAADPGRVALDLLIEAEHGDDSAALLVSHERSILEAVAARLPELIASTPEPRRAILQAVFGGGYGALIEVTDAAAAIDFANAYAAEHLLINTTDPAATAAGIRNAGEILLGPHTPFSLANYATGPNAVLPTGGWARTFSAVSVRDFERRIAEVRVEASAFDAIAHHVAVLAEYEGFPRHAAALRERPGVEGA